MKALTVPLKLKEVKHVSFTTKWYEVSVKGKIRSTIEKTACDFDELYLDKCEQNKVINVSSDRIKNPDFKLELFALKNKKTTLLLEFMPMDEDCDRYSPMSNDVFTILIHKGKVYSIPCSMNDVDTKELFK